MLDTRTLTLQATAYEVIGGSLEHAMLDLVSCPANKSPNS